MTVSTTASRQNTSRPTYGTWTDVHTGRPACRYYIAFICVNLSIHICVIRLATERREKGKTGKCAFAGTNREDSGQATVWSRLLLITHRRAQVSILMCSLTEQRQGRARGVSWAWFSQGGPFSASATITIPARHRTPRTQASVHALGHFMEPES